jgi:ATP-dependent RecD-like DNA helicase SH3 domain
VERFGVSFRAGGKVIQTRNNYDQDVFSGDIGLIRSLSLDDRELVMNFDGRRASYDFGALDEVEPAFAITVHLRLSAPSTPAAPVIWTKTQAARRRRSTCAARPASAIPSSA